MSTTLSPRQMRRAQAKGQVVVLQDGSASRWARAAAVARLVAAAAVLAVAAAGRWVPIAPEWARPVAAQVVLAAAAVVLAVGPGRVGRVARLVWRAVRLVWQSSFGRWRTFGWPLWIAGFAAVVNGPVRWAVAAGLLAALPTVRAWRGRRARVVSDREAYLWAGAMAAVAGAQAAAGLGLPVPWWAAPAVTVPTSGMWLWWRRIRKAGAFEQAWMTHVSTANDFKGTTLRAVEVKVDRDGQPDGTATVVVPKGQTAKGVARMDDVIASHLAEAFPGMTSGSVAVSSVPGDPVRHARMLVSNPRNLAKPRYWEEPTLDPATGLYVVGHTGHAWHQARMWQRAGGANTIAVGGPGKGKGGFTIVADVEAALSEHVVLIVLDGKRGAGLPALKDGAALYARTPGQWIVAWEAAVAIMRLRAEAYGELGLSLWSPMRDPLIKVTCDEWRYIHRAWPQMAEDAVWWTGQTRSYGGHLHLNLHKGDTDGYGNLEVRSNMYSNGQTWIGPQGDLSAEGVATQMWDVDTSALPPYPGYAYMAQTIEGSVAATTRIRTLWLPTEAEVAELGAPAPFGTAEDHLRAHAVFPTLPPAQQAILDTARELIESGRADNPDVLEEAQERARATGPNKDTADTLILGALAMEGEAGGTRIAELTGLNRAYVQERLSALARLDPPMVTQPAPHKPWHLTDYALALREDVDTDPLAELEPAP